MQRTRLRRAADAYVSQNGIIMGNERKVILTLFAVLLVIGGYLVFDYIRNVNFKRKVNEEIDRWESVVAPGREMGLSHRELKTGIGNILGALDYDDPPMLVWDLGYKFEGKNEGLIDLIWVESDRKAEKFLILNNKGESIWGGDISRKEIGGGLTKEWAILVDTNIVGEGWLAVITYSQDGASIAPITKSVVSGR